MATLDESTFQAVNNSNYKVMAELPMQNAVSHQNRMNVIAETATAKSIEALHAIGIGEAIAIKTATGGLAQAVAELGAAVSSIQQLVKAAQSTPPETGG